MEGFVYACEIVPHPNSTKFTTREIVQIRQNIELHENLHPRNFPPVWYLIKRPGVYFLATSVEGVFKRDGRLFETGVYCCAYFKLLPSTSYYAILDYYHSSHLKS